MDVKHASLYAANRKILPMSDQATASPPEQGSPAQHLIPAELEHLITGRPLLWFEDGDEYDALLSSVFAELDPKGAVEAILVKDIVDYVWEARRMRRLKTGALHAELPRSTSRFMGSAYGKLNEIDHGAASSHLSTLMTGATAGDDAHGEAMVEAMEECHVTPDVLLYEAYKSGLKTMSAINDELERLERRRDQSLRSLREQRAAIAAMAKSLVAREEATIVMSGSSENAA